MKKVELLKNQKSNSMQILPFKQAQSKVVRRQLRKNKRYQLNCVVSFPRPLRITLDLTMAMLTSD